MSGQRPNKEKNYAAKDVDKKAFSTEDKKNLHVDRNQFNYNTPQDSKQRQQKQPVNKSKPAVTAQEANQKPPPKPAQQEPANQTRPPQQQTPTDNWDAEINRDLERLKRFGLND